MKLLHDALSAYKEALKRFAEDMRWKEASKVRKLKSQLRARKMLEGSRRRMAPSERVATRR